LNREEKKKKRFSHGVSGGGGVETKGVKKKAQKGVKERQKVLQLRIFTWNVAKVGRTTQDLET